MPKEIPQLHIFENDISSIEKPNLFTFPFYYEPHQLSLLAAKEVQNYLSKQSDFDHNFGINKSIHKSAIGKMFGVLVVEDSNNNLGYIAGFSGKLAGSNSHHYFVPPIFDMLDPTGFFLMEEEIINQINDKISSIENAKLFLDIKQNLQKTQIKHDQKITQLRDLYRSNKQKRKLQRLENKNLLNEQDYQNMNLDLIKQSYRDKHEFQIIKTQFKTEIEVLEAELNVLLDRIDDLKSERKERSANLQNRLFDQYHFINAQKQSKSVIDIFQELNISPPAGAGECAAPKLLQFAYSNDLKPVCMAEFWWGSSPNLQVRTHENFYPACRGKCEPILNHMLIGLSVEANPLLVNNSENLVIEIIYEDQDIIVINKPPELLSVPGLHIQDSVQTRILKKYPEITGPLIIHRLDMSTSGIMILAKNKHAHQFIQSQFIKHTVNKRYTAILDGLVDQAEGIIDLPLRVDLDDRPRQVVCYEHGKKARTRYKVIQTENSRTRIHYYPLSGRTHQLRVHSAHMLGLGCPIFGDDLYGNRANRLHLHAGYIDFIHPQSAQRITFEVKDPF